MKKKYPYSSFPSGITWFCLSIGLILMGLGLGGCNPNASTNKLPIIKIGIVTGPQEKVLEKAKEIAAQKHHFVLEIMSFSNYMLPNMALAQGEIDANLFQTQIFLKESMAKQHLDLKILAPTFIYPMRLFGGKTNDLNALPDKAKIGIPNDPTNEERALRLLAAAHLITLKSENGTRDPVQTRTMTPEDIAENPHQYEIHTLDAAELPRVRPDFDLIALNNDFVQVAGLQEKEALWTEQKEGANPYINVIAVRQHDPNPLFPALIQVFRDPAVVQVAQAVSPGAIPAW